MCGVALRARVAGDEVESARLSDPGISFGADREKVMLPTLERDIELGAGGELFGGAVCGGLGLGPCQPQ